MNHPINQEAWEEWIEFRRVEKKKKVGPIAEKKQHKMLSQYPPEIQQEIIDSSIMNSYQGLFPPKGAITQPQKAGSTRDRSLTEDLNDRSWAK
jgi:hypothetical protein